MAECLGGGLQIRLDQLNSDWVLQIMRVWRKGSRAGFKIQW